MSPPRRLLGRLIAATALVAAAGIAAGSAQPAVAEPILHLHYPNVTGSTFVAKPGVTAPIPQSVFDADLDLGNGQLSNGVALIPDFPVTIRLLNLIPVTATVRLEAAGPITGMLTDRLSTTTTFRLRLVRVFQPALPRLSLVPRTCRTATTTTATLVNTTPVNIFDTTVAGSFTMPRFTGCGLLTPVLNLLLSGPGNTLTLRLQA